MVEEFKRGQSHFRTSSDTHSHQSRSLLKSENSGIIYSSSCHVNALQHVHVIHLKEVFLPFEKCKLEVKPISAEPF